jgi:methionyl-tRNA synthetase
MTQTAKRRIVVTSALPYANGSIHIGHLVEYLQTDIWARFQRMRGHECYYICADDTHGTPIMVKARELKIKPEELIARSHAEHAKDFADFGIHFDIYSSTNSDENRQLAEEMYTKFRDAGHTETKEIQQLYCNHDKMFLPDRFVKGTCPVCATPDQYGDSCDKCGATYSPSELKNPRCSICGTPPVMKGSEHVFFKLNNFKPFLQDWMPKHTQKDVSGKLLEWFEQDLRSWDISRDDPYFGFAIPGFKDKYFYVWVDAPMGYVSSTLQLSKKNGIDFDSIWRKKNSDWEVYHFIGKDITYFHCLFWPAMLQGAGFRQPSQVMVHGHLTVNGEKMSKSKGTSITARTYLDHLDPMYLRYYYACKLTGSVNDLDLNVTDFVNRVNSDLVGKITNLGSRGAQMLSKRIDGKLGRVAPDGRRLIEAAQAKSESIASHFENRDFAKAMTEIRDIADEANKYFDEKAPWNMIKEDVEGTRAVLTATLNIFRMLAIYLQPVLPVYAGQVSALLGETEYKWTDAQKIIEDCAIGEYQHLATRAEQVKFEKAMEASMSAPTSPSTAPAAATLAPTTTAPAAAASAGGTPTEIDFEEFAKVDLRIAKIIEAEEIVEADKLLRLKVDLGEMGQRQIIAGIKSAYKAADLVGRLTVIVANLKPRKMKFGMSEGMVLAAGPGGKELFIMSPDSGAQPGQKVK